MYSAEAAQKKREYYLRNIERIKAYRENYNPDAIIFKSFMKDGFRYKKCCACKVIQEENAFSKKPDCTNKIWKREKNCRSCEGVNEKLS